MVYVKYFVVIAIAAFLMGLLFLLLKSHKVRQEPAASSYPVVCLPRVYFYIGAGFIILSLLPLTAMEDRFQNPVAYFFLFFDVLCFAMCINQANWKLYLDKNAMIHCNCFLRKKEILYSEIEYVKNLSTGDILIKMKKRIFPIVIDKFAINSEAFIKLYNKYKLSLKEQ